MAKKIKQETNDTERVVVPQLKVRGHSRRILNHVSHPSPHNYPAHVQRRANRLGEMLRKGLIDGVSLEATSLLRSQWDEAFDIDDGDGKKRMYVDPSSDIHTDKFAVADAEMRSARKTMTEKLPS